MEIEIKRSKQIMKMLYIVEKYFGLSHQDTGAQRTKFTTIINYTCDAIFRQTALNMFRGSKLFVTA